MIRKELIRTSKQCCQARENRSINRASVVKSAEKQHASNAYQENRLSQEPTQDDEDQPCPRTEQQGDRANDHQNNTQSTGDSASEIKG